MLAMPVNIWSSWGLRGTGIRFSCPGFRCSGTESSIQRITGFFVGPHSTLSGRSLLLAAMPAMSHKRHSMYIGGADCGDTAGSVRTACLATILEPVAVRSELPQFHSGQKHKHPG
jgi:hypothetical protein